MCWNEQWDVNNLIKYRLDLNVPGGDGGVAEIDVERHYSLFLSWAAATAACKCIQVFYDVVRFAVYA